MDSVYFEISKILHRRSTLILLVATTILFPAVIKVISHLNVIKDNVAEDFFSENVAFAIIAYTQTYFFLPVWIILLTGHELSNGHVNRVIFTRSRKFYFSSKLIFCGIVTLYFSLLGLIAMLISIKTSPFSDLIVPPVFYLQFVVQLTLSSFLFSLLLLCLLFFIASPLKAFVLYFVWNFLEGMLFTFVDALYNVQLKWLPLHLVRTLYTVNGETQLANYYNPFIENYTLTIIPFGFIFVTVFIAYKHFSRANLPALSD